MDSNQVLRFDRFTLDRARGRLRADGVDVELRPKSFEVLRQLVENAGRLVSKDELARVVWPHVVVTDDSLVQCISDVRKVLCDDGQRFIKTVPRRGYVFVADVGVDAAAPPPAAHGNRRRPGARAVGWALALVMVAALSVWAFIWHTDRSNPQRLTIAVLPFASIGPTNDRHFSDGLAEDVITAISRFRDVTVIARNSSFRYRDDVDITKVGSELGAAFVIKGSVGRDEGRVRINVQLLDTGSGATRWAERYDRPLGSVFELQDEVADQVVSKLVGHARHLTVERIRTRHPKTLEAYELVLRARQGFIAFSRQGAIDAHTLLQQATAIDPDYAPAWELLARVLLRFYIVPYDDRQFSAPVLADAHQAALKAVALDPDFSLAHGALGYAQLWLQQYDASLASLRHAIALNPNDADTFRNYGDALGKVGDHKASIEAFERSRRLDPFSPPIVFGLMARAHNMLGEHDRALPLARECAERAPGLPICFMMIAVAMARLGQPDEAQAAVRRLLELDPRTSIRRLTQPKRFRFEADDAVWVEQLRAAGIPE
ncbi:winged helix-turn-helix domain-containing protein [Variovorax paradoxus]|nr:winged helix-turn-helix domain-containing protein [Variovorax paradoxus]